MGTEVRTIAEQELPAWLEAMRVGFLSHSQEGAADVFRPLMDLGRTFGAFDGSRVVGTLRSFPTDLTVPGGGSVSCAALTNVTVTGTHRRRGLLTEMMTRDLADCADRGEATGALIAAEYPIYGRFGYGPATESVSLVIDAAAQFVVAPDRGSLEVVDRTVLRAEAPAVYARERVRWPGAIRREDRWWDYDLGIEAWPGRPEKPDRFFVLARDAEGRADGFAVYHVEDRWESARPRGTLHVEELVGDGPGALARLWRYCLGVDWISTVKVEDRGPDELLPWLLADARMVETHVRSDLQWVRIIDPVAALEGRRYLAEGGVVLEIDDPLGHATGRFMLEGGPDGASCRPTTVSADLRLGAGTLGAVYLGGPTLVSQALAGRVDELTPGSLARADAMFRSALAPWCMTHF